MLIFCLIISIMCILLGFYDRFDRRRVDELMRLGVNYEFDLAARDKEIFQLENDIRQLMKDYNQYIDLTSKSMEKLQEDMEKKMLQSLHDEALTSFLLNNEPRGEA